MPADDTETLQDILKAAEAILQFTRGGSREALTADEMKLSAVLYQIIILGEATRRLSTEFRNRHPEVPWADIIGMRSIVVHEYDEVDAEEVWAVIERDLPDLIRKIKAMLQVS